MPSNRGYRPQSLNDDEFDDAVAARIARKNRRKNNLKWFLCVSVVVIVIIAIFLILFFALRNNESSASCHSDVLAYCIDGSYDPCDDFYRYSCGYWLADNPLNGRTAISSFSDLFVDNYRHLRNYLSRSVQDSDLDAIKKSKYIYSSCADVDYIQGHLVEHVQDFIRDAGGWSDIGIYPDVGWSINRSLANDHYLGSSALFDFGISPDDLNSTKSVIRINQGGLTLASPQAYNSSDFTKLAEGIKSVLDRLDNTRSHDSLAKEIANFEKSLAAEWLTDTELRNVSAQYNPMTLQKLQNDLFNLDWVGYFTTIFQKFGVSISFYSDTVVIVNTPTYFRNLQQLISHNTSTFIKYARWQLVLSEYLFSTASLESSWTIMHERKFPKSFKLSDSASFACIELTERTMPFAVARPFVDELINRSTINKVNKTINNIEAAFVQNLMEKDWLDDVTKDNCTDKVDTITSQIAYPDFIEVDGELNAFYEELQINSSMNHFEIGTALRTFIYHQHLSAYTRPTDKTQWFVPPTQVNAYYSPELNQIVFLAGILRSPFFAIDYSPYRLYGGLGSVIGHELTHGFDDQGQQYNKDGNRIPWWTSASMANFTELSQCFVGQYGNYSLQGYQIDGRLTLGENIADNGGVRTAFRAFRNVMNGTTDEQQLIDGHTADQLFFVAFAQLWCSEASDDHLKKSTVTDPHSPGEFRTIGSMVNNRDFATAFNCSVGSRMNPINKCQLW